MGTTHSQKVSQPISRVLSRTVIYLGYASPLTSSGLPRTTTYGPYDTACCLVLYLALLRAGFTMPRIVANRAVRSYHTLSPLPAKKTGGLLSAALSVGLRPPGITWHSARWSPDFPPLPSGSGDCLADSGHRITKSAVICE